MAKLCLKRFQNEPQACGIDRRFAPRDAYLDICRSSTGRCFSGSLGRERSGLLLNGLGKQYTRATHLNCFSGSPLEVPLDHDSL
jgi:hypothetical protein